MKRTLNAATVAAAIAAGTTALIPGPARSEATTLDSSVRNKQVVRRIYEECINGHKLELLPELVSADYLGAQDGRGPSAFRSNIEELQTGFPDIRFTLHDLIAEGDRVAVRWTWKATHTGRFRSWAPSGRRVANSGIAIYELEQGKVVRVWLETDRLGALQQIGAIPPTLVPAAPSARR
jgi:predicted ester cyclase